ncbi:alpha/beta hydrolase [Novosphingobium subterraneum]|uniref:Alpha/beta hydrolase n=1 Tax=Novosphingobium subterraneum TaxID=48936 RepID=A0A0B8ZCC5_9SPHN|nr:alpha/beta hydrolase [Novosphingobium subterraneum]KHS43908.1 hypothetical protein NJ75_03528 [Novosphingobium subterraneum]
MKLRLLLAPLAMLAAPLVAQDAAPVSRMIEGTLASGAKWQALVPANFNGSLLLWSHGYSPRIDPAEPAPAQYRDLLLAKGYALVASDYGAGGWSLEQAVPAQRATVEAFVAREGRPARVLAWGSSMGGLISTALAEQDRPVIDGALAMCPSIGGAVGMMNMGLDGAFATAALIAPNSGLSLVNVADDMANGRKAWRQSMLPVKPAKAGRGSHWRVCSAAFPAGPGPSVPNPLPTIPKRRLTRSPQRWSWAPSCRAMIRRAARAASSRGTPA